MFFSKKSNFFLNAALFAVPLRQLLSGAHEARERTRRFRAAALSSAAVPGAHESRERYAVSGLRIWPPAGGGRTALPRGAKRIDNLRFSILLGLQLSLCSQVGARNGFTVPICARDRKRRTAVPLPARRLGLTPTIPFTATLKPLELCDSIYAKPVQSAASPPRQREKREPIPFLYASYL